MSGSRAGQDQQPEDQLRGFRFLRDAQQEEPWPWFREHFDDAAAEIVEFLAGDGISLENRQVADVGCGEGIIDLGLAVHAKPRQLVGFDLIPVDVVALLDEARREGVELDALPAGLEFRTSTLTGLPAPDASFDVLVSWSTFEHVRRPVALLNEMRRVLRPDGLLFLQIWPLYRSQHGSHLWPWFPTGYAQLENDDEELHRVVRADDRGRPADAEFVLREYRELNQITVDELQRSLQAAGFFITKFELLAGATRITPELARYSLSELGISGIKLIAVAAR
jgi:SAM-dependent methyltransferase